MGDLTMRMYPSVCTARAVDRDTVAIAQRAERRFEPILDRFAVRLTLPPLERPAIVGDHQPQPQRRLVHGRVSPQPAEPA